MTQQFLIPLMVKPGSTVIDVGANLGQLTFPLSKLVGPYGNVYAFEPITHNFAKLQQLIVKGKLRKNIKLVKMGLSNKPSISMFTIPKDRLTEATLIPHSGQDWSDFSLDKSNYLQEQCELTTLDNFIELNGSL